MSAASVIDRLCTYFGGPYDPGTRSYRSPQLTVPGMTMGATRRAKPKRFDATDFTLGAVGSDTACVLYIFLTPGDETREGFGGATGGLKKVRHFVWMDFLIRSTGAYAEDVQDVMYALQEAVTDRIHADITCGSGGIEAGGFQVGEGGSPWIHWIFSEPYTNAEETKTTVRVNFAADEYIIA